MKYYVLKDSPSTDLQEKLDKFEEQFTYPLGENSTFSISHHPHYLNFYLAMGEAICIVAHNEHGVQGTICASKRKIIFPDVNDEQNIFYIGDLKVTPAYQNKTLSYRLMMHLMEERYNPTIPLVSVVMEGTNVTPDNYTGRLGLPAFSAFDKYYILQLKAQAYVDLGVDVCSNEKGIHRFAEIYQKPYFKPHSIPLRAKPPFEWICYKEESCALFENTMNAKRLFINDGNEMKNAHLSYLAFRKPESAYPIISHALALAKDHNYEALFLALTENEYHELSKVLKTLPVIHVAKARVYGSANVKSIHFNLNTAEI